MKYFFMVFSAFFMALSVVQAVGMSVAGLTFSVAQDLIIEDKSYRIYAEILNETNDDVIGVATFFNETLNKNIGSDRVFSVVNGDRSKIFIDWRPSSRGENVIRITLKPDDGDVVVYKQKVFVDRDFDGDGMPNRFDKDDDGDGTPDVYDAFPFNIYEWRDTDKDGIGDNVDPDDDGDGISDEEERLRKTNPLKSDSDGDGVDDKNDVWPLDPQRSLDTDGDGVADEFDDDIDGDGTKNEKDAFPRDAAHVRDSDGDGKADEIDAFPNDATEWSDQDGDGVGDNADAFDNNKRPTAILRMPRRVYLDKQFNLDSVNSHDEDGEVVKRWWKISCVSSECVENGIKIAESTEKSWVYTFDKKGNYVIRLTVEDNIGERHSVEKNVSVGEQPLVPFGWIALGGAVFLAVVAVITGKKKKYRRKVV